MSGVYRRAFRRGMKQDPKLQLSEWADEHFVLSPESSATSGRWTCIPYQRGILDAFSDPDVEFVTVMKSARVGYTKILNIVVASCIAETPCNVMVVQPTLTDAEGYSTAELSPMLRDVPKLRGAVADAKFRDNSNTMLRKSFTGGQVMLVGANSAAGFRRVSAKYVLFDEVDGYPPTAGAEGDQIKLGIRRTEFFHDRKIALGSTPTIKGFSRIEASYERSDKRKYFVPCPACGSMQDLKWSGIEWQKDKPETAAYRCDNDECEALIPHSKKKWMIERGEWVATAPFAGHAGFHIWAGYSYSPNATWADLAKEFLEAKAAGPEELQTFVNTVLGETWEAEGSTGIESDTISNRREDYDADEVLPDGVIVAVAGVDCQDDRLEVEVLGVGLGEESWSLGYFVILGNPGTSQPWRDLEKILQRTYTTSDDVEISIAAACVDSGGHHTESVYNFVRGKERRRIYAVKGGSHKGKPMVGRPTRNNKGKIPLVPINTIAAKDLLFARLSLTEHGSGFCHFPAHYDDEYFAMLTAERVATKYRKGVAFREYIQTRRRNEALDCRVYAMAALRLLNARLTKVAANVKKKAKKIKQEIDADSAAIESSNDREKQVRIRKKRPSRRRGGGYVNKWKS